MPPRVTAGIRLAPPAGLGGRLFVPVLRMVTVVHEGGGMASCTPVALLVGEGDAWSFIALEEGIGQDILSGLDLPGLPG